MHKVWSCIESAPRLIDSSSFVRGLPFKEYLRDCPDVVEVFKTVLLSGHTRESWRRDDKGRWLAADEGIRTCFVNGWLQTELEELDSEEPDTVFVSLISQLMEWKLQGLHLRFLLNDIHQLNRSQRKWSRNSVWAPSMRLDDP